MVVGVVLVLVHVVDLVGWVWSGDGQGQGRVLDIGKDRGSTDAQGWHDLMVHAIMHRDSSNGNGSKFGIFQIILKRSKAKQSEATQIKSCQGPSHGNNRTRRSITLI